jgi:hypothetical protein
MASEKKKKQPYKHVTKVVKVGLKYNNKLIKSVNSPAVAKDIYVPVEEKEKTPKLNSDAPLKELDRRYAETPPEAANATTTHLANTRTFSTPRIHSCNI